MLLIILIFLLISNHQTLKSNHEGLTLWGNEETLPEKSSVPVRKMFPDSISDFRAYLLGIPNPAIDRLLEARKTGVSLKDSLVFKTLLNVPDSSWQRIKKYLIFPKKYGARSFKNSKDFIAKEKVLEKDLNKATAADLKTIYGIGDKLSERIVKYRTLLGGFQWDDQLYKVYGLDSLVVSRILKNFKIISRPEIVPINLNHANSKELSLIPYINKTLAESIVRYRTEKGKIRNIEELTNLHDFPAEKIDRIRLYLKIE